VPEAPIDKHCDSLSREDDVGSSPPIKLERALDAEAKAPAV
jgi:hypothetical protein